MDIINKYFSENYKPLYGGMLDFSGEPFIKIRPKVRCKDGFEVSIQASSVHYCSPRHTFKPAEDMIYTEVELGFPNGEDDLIKEFAEDPFDLTATVYPYVPVDIVVKLIEKHGGIIE